ncbi:PREDICTED: leiomodin-2-like [Nanorana parkeri]|uniref:leiomodin-2-like n=1 Tax=Nanorana parkeri TaxID=125878 RepID=UPI0008543A5A|nr:PREDICTED: leiomodin-2-like [Nanorana parkeri]
MSPVSDVTERSMELSAELTGRDGSRRPFRVGCERTLRGLLGGLERLQGEVTAELSRLVERERSGASGAGVEEVEEEEEEEEEDEEEDDDDSDEEDGKNNGIHHSVPPAKRKKT